MPNREAISYSNPSEVSESPEDIEATKLRSRKIGAKMLARAGFTRHSIVEKSFNRAIENGEKLPGNNSERRATAHLERLERVDEHGGEASKQLWKRAKESIQLPSDPEQRAKAEATLDEYLEFFSAEDCPFPTWFKVFAWDGLTNLKDTYTQKDGIYVFQKRDETSQANFPALNPAALARSFDAIVTRFGLPAQQDYTEYNLTEEDSDKVDKLIQSGSFNRIYSYELSRKVKKIEVPENPEDVHGVWEEYDSLDDIQALTEAAQNTSWCIVRPSTAENYLGVRTDENGHDYIPQDSKAKFILFHLIDPKTNLPSKQACASIRLNTEGGISEISGIVGRNGEQRLNDSLIDIVQEKASQYPGYESNQKGFENARTIARLDQKRKANEPFTLEELSFARMSGTAYLEDLHRGPDSRSDALSEYASKQIIEALKNPDGTDDEKAELIRILDNPQLIIENLQPILEANVSIDTVLQSIGTNAIIKHYATLREANISDEAIFGHIGNSATIARNFNKLREAGADEAKILSFIDGKYICSHFGDFIKDGVEEDKILDSLSPWDILYSYITLKNAGANEEKLRAKVDSQQVAEYNKTHDGASEESDRFIENVYPSYIASNFKYLEATGIDREKLLGRFDTHDLIANYKALRAAIDEPSLLARLDSKDVIANYSTLKESSADEEKLVAKLDSKEVIDNLYHLLSAKANEDAILSRLSATDIGDNFDLLIRSDIAADKIASRLEPADTIKHLGELLDAGVDQKIIIDKLSPEDIIDNLGAFDIPAIGQDVVLKQLNSPTIAHNFQYLVDSGFSISSLLEQLEPDDINANLNEITQAGVSIDQIKKSRPHIFP